MKALLLLYKHEWDSSEQVMVATVQNSNPQWEDITEEQYQFLRKYVDGHQAGPDNVLYKLVVKVDSIPATIAEVMKIKEAEIKKKEEIKLKKELLKKNRAAKREQIKREEELQLLKALQEKYKS